MINLLKEVKKAFGTVPPSTDINTELLRRISSFTENSDNILMQIKSAKEESLRTNQMLESVANYAGGMLWLKDSDNKYLFANEYHCKVFFALPKECQGDIIGMSDLDLINEYIERTNKWHTFGDVCALTDNHCIAMKDKCFYVEVGSIGGKEVVLKVIKTPIYEGTALTGTVGYAMIVTFDCASLFDTLRIGLVKGLVEALSTSVFWVKDPNTCTLYNNQGTSIQKVAKNLYDTYQGG